MVQYEAFIRQNETELIDSNTLLRQVTNSSSCLASFAYNFQINNALTGSRLDGNASFFFIQQLMSER